MVSDRIELRGLRAYGYHGVLAHERAQGQPFVLDVLLELDTQDAARTDDLVHTVSYAQVAHDVIDMVQGEPVNLIETLAHRVAMLVLADRLVESVEVAVHKPQAPIGVQFDDVVVRVRRERAAAVVIAIGGNLGDVGATFVAAVDRVGALDGVAVDRVAEPVGSDPVGGPDQPAYLNTVLLARTRLAPQTLLARLHEIEHAYGRTRQQRWGPRTLDLDLIQYGNPDQDDPRFAEVTAPDSGQPLSAQPGSGHDGLMLPHPRAHERAFVLEPWHRADPAARLRVGDRIRDVADLLADLDRSGLHPRSGPVLQPESGAEPC